MKRSNLLPLLILLFPSLVGCDQNRHLINKGEANVYLILGQSNASGVSPFSFLKEKDPDSYEKYSKPNSDAIISYRADLNQNDYFEPTKFGFGCTKEYFGPEVGIASSLSSEPKRSYIIKTTLGGTHLNGEWLFKGKRGDLYKDSVARIHEKLSYLKQNGADPRVKGVFWMQGEGDSYTELDVSIYKSNTEKLIAYLEEDFNEYIRDYMNFVDATIKSIDDSWPRAKDINQAKIDVANESEHHYCVLTNDEDETALNLKTKNMTGEGDDAAHYDCTSMIALGEAAGNYLKK
ncbi:MAG: sialate O-acetylesterase [Bacilli bacterium]|nr:sialate O-acetylesterase [Bacilli bacterium]